MIESKRPLGNYIYAWYKDDEATPFYIGRGGAYRAWVRHTKNGEDAYCETIRKTCERFQVKILRDRLTPSEAIALERNIIELYQPIANYQTLIRNDNDERDIDLLARFAESTN